MMVDFYKSQPCPKFFFEIVENVVVLNAEFCSGFTILEIFQNEIKGKNKPKFFSN
jgi:hypothetical protein